jgi:hypothetical protein
MEQHNLTYKPPIKPRVSSAQKQDIKKGQKDSNSYQEPLERFKKLFEERKQKKNPARTKGRLLLMKCKYCLQTNVVKNGQLSYDQYYRCRSCNRYFRRTLLDDTNPKEIQGLLELITS